MNVVILNGSDRARDPADEAAGMLERRFLAEGSQVRHYFMRELSIGHCLGEFDCWVRTPGRCRIKDEGQEIERAVHDANVLAYVTPVLFGGCGPQLKKGMDRLIPLILPFFVKRAGLTHHGHRYEGLPRMLGLGIDASPSDERAALFSAFIESAALNLGSPAWASTVLGEAPLSEHALDFMLAPSPAPGNATGSARSTQDYLEAVLRAEASTEVFSSSPRVAILQASAREPGTSTSQSIASFLEATLQGQGAKVDVVQATRFARGAATAEAAARVLADADVLAVVAPLYVDALPYLGLLGLQQALIQRSGCKRPQRVIGVINCGFPEPAHLRFAFASLRHFARDAGAVYAGGIAVGGGQLIHGRDLVQTGGITQGLRRGLQAAAQALAQGGLIPHAVSLASAHPMLPPFLYRFAGTVQWTLGAHAHGMKTRELRAAPFDAMSAEAWEREAAAGVTRARPLRVVGKTTETDDAVTLYFEDPAHDPLRYQAGQFITLELTVDGVRVRRAYSLASAPGEPGLAITVKRVPGGLVSNHIHDAVVPGDVLRSHGPSGSFVVQPVAHGGPCLLMFGGGSGIVPLAAIARHELRTQPRSQITLVYGAATRERAIYAAALDELASLEPERFRLHWVLETPPPQWAGAAGRLDEQGLAPVLSGISLAQIDQVMVCGPDAMRASVRTVLAARGLDEAKVIEESFISPRAAEGSSREETATLLPPSGPPRPLRVAPGHTLLEAALEAEEAISFSCMSGGCGACRIRVVEGLDQIVLDAPNDVSAADRACGRLPACIVRLRGPVSFRVGDE